MILLHAAVGAAFAIKAVWPYCIFGSSVVRKTCKNSTVDLLHWHPFELSIITSFGLSINKGHKPFIFILSISIVCQFISNHAT